MDLNRSSAICIHAAALLCWTARAVGDDSLPARFQWNASQPVVAPAVRPDDLCYSLKDPTFVFHDGRWHLFWTTRSQKKNQRIEYSSFAGGQDANQADRFVLSLWDSYF